MRTSPESVNLIALPTKFSNTWAMRRSSPDAAGKSAGTADFQCEILLGCQRLRAGDNRLDHIFDRIRIDRQRQLAGLDLGEVEHVVDQAEQMAAALIDALVDIFNLLRQLAVDVHQQHARVAQHGIHRRSQLMAHARQELRLVLARQLQLLPFLLDLAEQPRVVDRQSGLRRESLQQIHHFGLEFPGLAPPNRQASHDLLLAE